MSTRPDQAEPLLLSYEFVPCESMLAMSWARLPFSSGDLIADRRHAIAQDFERRGDFDLLTQALEMLASPRLDARESQTVGDVGRCL
jgi:hypothetical protein